MQPGQVIIVPVPKLEVQVSKRKPTDADSAALVEGRRLYAALARELPPARAAKIAAELSGASRRALYAVEP